MRLITCMGVLRLQVSVFRWQFEGYGPDCLGDIFMAACETICVPVIRYHEAAGETVWVTLSRLQVRLLR